MNKLQELSASMRVVLKTTYAGKVWVYAPVHDKCVWTLGIAVANEPGYFPILGETCQVSEGKGAYEIMVAYAERLNEDRGFGALASARIIASTMAAQNRKQAG